MNKKYVVRLEAEERERLQRLVSNGRAAAQKITPARLFLQADVSEAGWGWPDGPIAGGLGVTVCTIESVRQGFVEEGLKSALERQKQAAPSVPQERDGAKDAKRVAIDRDRGRPCGPAPPTPPCVRVRTRRFGRLCVRSWGVQAKQSQSMLTRPWTTRSSDGQAKGCGNATPRPPRRPARSHDASIHGIGWGLTPRVSKRRHAAVVGSFRPGRAVRTASRSSRSSLPIREGTGSGRIRFPSRPHRESAGSAPEPSPGSASSPGTRSAVEAFRLQPAIVVDPIEELVQIEVHHPRPAFDGIRLGLFRRFMGDTLRTKAVTVRRERRFPHRSQSLQDGLLNQAVQPRGDVELAHHAVGFRNLRPPNRLRFVRPVQQLLPDVRPVGLQRVLQWMHSHPVHARRIHTHRP